MSYPVANSFWSASSGWYAARKEAQAKNAAAGGIFKGIAHKEAAWKAKGSAYLRGRPDLQRWFKTEQSDAYMVRVDPRLSKALADIVDRINPTIVRAIDEHVGKLALAAFDAWPTDSGLSKALIGLEFRAEGDTFTASIVNTAPYVFFIKGSPHRKLLEGPAGKIAIRIVRDVQAAMAAK